MKEILLNDLPRYSEWPAKLLSDAYCPCARAADRRRNVLREYDQDKYGPLLRHVQQHSEVTASDLARREMGDPQREVAGTVDGRLYAGPLGEFRALAEERLVFRVLQEVERLNVRTVVDLGCGWGYLLIRLRGHLGGKSLRGGELSPTAVKIADALNYETGVDQFDFYEGDCLPLEKAEPPVLVVTSYALHQLAAARIGLDAMYPYRDKIAGCLSFEPIEDFYDDSILGLLRKRYQQACGYSADLLRQLEVDHDVELRGDPIPNSIGINALLPGSFVSWGFR